MTDSTHILASDAVLNYVTAGKACVTILNTETEGRHTYRVNAPGRTAEERDAAEILFVSVMTGTDNDNPRHYKYIGIIIRQSGAFRTTAKTKLPLTDARVKGMEWLMRNVKVLDRFPHVEIRHHNRCGKCNRVLTVPESIDTGLGPICAAARGVAWERNAA